METKEKRREDFLRNQMHDVIMNKYNASLSKKCNIAIDLSNKIRFAPKSNMKI